MKLFGAIFSTTLFWACTTGDFIVSAFLTSQTKITSLTSLSMAYVPDGMTPEQYKKLKQKEEADKAAKKFGAYGPQSFKSRSLQSFQKDMEEGKAGHLMPMMNAKSLLKQGKIKQQDIPYMQRGGNWDDSDVKGAKKKAANKYDKKYEANARPGRIDWMGVNQRRGGPAAAATKKEQAPPQKKKGWFGFSP